MTRWLPTYTYLIYVKPYEHTPWPNYRYRLNVQI